MDSNICEQWFKVNPDIYVMAKDIKTKEVVAYVNISPVTDKCYEQIKNGEKFCKFFGMIKVRGSDHNSSVYEVSMIPPKFRVSSKKTKELYDYYQKKYQEAPYLFDSLEI